MTCPIVSVIIPCYNAEKNLAQCIDGICRQTLEQIQIICVDDGSTDTTLEILQDYQKKDPRIQVIRQQNAGAGAARNAGLERATGEYLSFLDADAGTWDVMEETRWHGLCPRPSHRDAA